MPSGSSITRSTCRATSWPRPWDSTRPVTTSSSALGKSRRCR